MVSEFSMSKEVGPVAMVRREMGSLLPGFGEQTLGGSGVQRTLVDEVKHIVEYNYARATQILKSNRHILETLAQELLDIEDMDWKILQERLDILMRDCQKKQ